MDFTVASLAEAVRTKRVSPVELVRDCLARIDRRNPTLKRLRARSPIGSMADAGGFSRGELQRVKFVVVEGAQVNAVALAPALGKSEYAGEEIETGLRFIGEKLDVSQMGDVVDRLGLHTFSLPALGTGVPPFASPLDLEGIVACLADTAEWPCPWFAPYGVDDSGKTREW